MSNSSFSSYIIPLTIIAIGIYLLYKYGGEFFGNIFGDALGGITGDVGRGITQGAEVGGLTGAVGGGIYESFIGKTETLRERIIERVADTGEDWTKAGVHIVAEDIHEAPFKTGFIGAILPPFSGFTIGAGIATIQKWGEYLTGLPEEERRIERWGEYERRSKWMEEHPVETIIGFPAHIIHTFTQPGMIEAPTEVLTERIRELGATPTTESKTALASEYMAEITRRRIQKEIPPRVFTQPDTILAKTQPTKEEIEKIVATSPIMQTPIGQQITRDLMARYY